MVSFCLVVSTPPPWCASKRVSRQPLETFSIGFKEARFDEREYARYVANKFGTRHHEFLLKPGSIEIIEQIAWHTDEPFADSSALPTCSYRS